MFVAWKRRGERGSIGKGPYILIVSPTLVFTLWSNVTATAVAGVHEAVGSGGIFRGQPGVAGGGYGWVRGTKGPNVRVGVVTTEDGPPGGVPSDDDVSTAAPVAPWGVSHPFNRQQGRDDGEEGLTHPSRPSRCRCPRARPPGTARRGRCRPGRSGRRCRRRPCRPGRRGRRRRPGRGGRPWRWRAGRRSPRRRRCRRW